MSDDEQGPPGPPAGPEPDDDCDTEAEATTDVEDNYARRNGAATIATLLNDTFGDTVLDASKYTNEWWEKREQDLADLNAKNVAIAERDRMRHRAEILVQSEGQSGLRCAFPRWAVEAAQRVHLDTLAMKHTRKFLDDAGQESAADLRRRMGEHEDGDGPHRDPPRILVLGGGTGGGKTTAATWLAIKSTDALPGFIRASELERRGRYDKILRTWIPERTSLVIDDIGAELLDGKGVFRSFLDEIVDTFYSTKRRLVLTTNLKPKITDEHRAECVAEGREPEPQFRERYGDRVRSRIVQIGQWSECGNTDLREAP